MDSRSISDCPYCTSNKCSRVSIEESHERAYWYKCSECDLGFVNEVPSSTFLSNYYKNYYSNSDSPAITSDQSFAFVNHLENFIDKYLIGVHSVGISILDWGGGDGTLSILMAINMLNKYNQISISLCICDLNANNLIGNKFQIKEKFGDRLRIQTCATLPDVDGVFDFVMCSAILEHVPEIRQNIESLDRLIAINGLIYFRTPYMLPFKTILRSAFDMTYPAHIYDIGPNFYHHISRKNNWTVIKIGASPVDTSFRIEPFRTFVAYFFKLLWRITKGRWKFIGGCELVAQKNVSSS